VDLTDNGRVPKKQKHHQSFSDLVDEVKRAVGPRGRQAIPSPRPISHGEWTDNDGVLWHRRGGVIAGNKIKRLLLNPAVPVLLCYGTEPRLVAAHERRDLWDRMQPYVTGRGSEHTDDFTSFDAAEFRDDQRRSMLVIEESC